MELETREDVVLGFYENGELAAICRKNGSTDFYRVEKMNYTGLVDLFKVNKLV